MERLEPEKCSLESSDSLPASEAFSLIGNEIRVTILEALWQSESEPVSFSRLYGMSGAENSAKFNYHLDQLTGHYVRKTDSGYELRAAGESVVRSIVEGSFTAHPEFEPFETGAECTDCASMLEATYQDEKLGIRCPHCDRHHGEFAFPPAGLLERGRDEVLEAFDQRVRFTHSLASEGVCPECGGQMRTSIGVEDEVPLDIEHPVRFRCEQCQQEMITSIGLAIREKVPVIRYHSEIGVDLRSTPYWELEWCVSDEAVNASGDGDSSIEISIPCGDRVMTFAVDRDLNIQERPVVS